MKRNRRGTKGKRAWEGRKVRPFGGEMAESARMILLKQGVELLLEHLEEQHRGTGRVGRRETPEKMASRIHATAEHLHLEDLQEPCDASMLLDVCRVVLDTNPKSGHPLFFNQLYGKPDEVGVLGDWLVVAANAHVHTYEAAPAFVVVEKEILDKLARTIGGEYEKEHDGLFVPGGSMGNFYGMLVARHHAHPNVRKTGLHGGPALVAFSSEQSHYSYTKAAAVLGIGTDNMIPVKCDEYGSMVPEELDKAVVRAQQEGKQPFFVGATAGTTVTGAYDPLLPLHKICKKHNLWMHVDGVWGGPVLLSRRHRHLMAGAEHADSIAWCAHKLLGAPTQCAAFITKHGNHLLPCNASAASYLFQPEKCGAAFDPGDKSFMCGRRADMFKLWLMWKHVGDLGMEKIVDDTISMAAAFEELILGSEGKFQLVQPRTYANVCFWYIPRSLRPFRIENASAADMEQIGSVTSLLKGKLHEAGDAMINYQSMDGVPNFFRIVFRSHCHLDIQDLEQMLERMDSMGETL